MIMDGIERNAPDAEAGASPDMQEGWQAREPVKAAVPGADVSDRPVGFFRRAIVTLNGTMQIFLDAEGIQAGAATAFYGAFSVAPLLVILTSIAAWIWGDHAAQEAILNTLRDLLGEREAQTLAGMLHRSLDSISTGKAISGVLFAIATTLVGASGMFVQLRSALQAMAEQSPSRSAWQRFVRMRLVVIGVVLGCAVLVAVAILLQTVALGFVKWVSLEWPGLSGIVQVFELLWSWSVIVALFYVVMHWLPDKRFSFKATLAGAMFGGALFMVGRAVIGYYITHSIIRSSLGAASSFAALLFWLYWSSLVFLLGAAFAGQLTRNAAAKRKTRRGKISAAE